MSPPAVECVGLVQRYGELTAVDGLNMRIEPGEVFGLLGPNGAGKTTTIRVLATLLPVGAGRVRVFGLDVARHAQRVRSMLGYVPQQLSVEAGLTGRQNVMWFARLYRVPRRERAERTAAALDAMGLLDAADRIAGGYSGGMFRRLELAQAMVARPPLLVLDEPTVGLDPIARDGVWQRMARLRAEHGVTVLLTTHYMQEADALCDTVALMHRGRVAAAGRPADLKAELGAEATLEDVFRHWSGAELAGAEGVADSDTGIGGLADVRRTRRTARRLG